MDSIITSSSQNSALLVSLSNEKLSDIWTYRVSSNVLNSAKSYVVHQPRQQFSTPFHGREAIFDFSKIGAPEFAAFRLSYTKTADAADSSLNGKQAAIGSLKRVSIVANGTTIFSYGPEYVRARLAQASSEETLIWQSMLNGYTGAAANTYVATAIVQTIPLFTNFTLESGSTFNLLHNQYSEVVSVRVELASQAEMGLVTAVSAASIEMVASYRTLSPQALNAYKASMYPINRRVNQLVYDTYTESPTILSTVSHTTGADLIIRCPNVVSSISFYVSPAGVPFNLTDLTAPQYGIASVSLSLGGVKLLDNISVDALKHSNTWYKHNNLTVSQVGVITTLCGGTTTSNCCQGVHTINFAALMDRFSMTGAVSMLNVNGITLSVKTNAASSTSYQLNAVCEYFKVMSIDSNSGKINISTSL